MAEESFILVSLKEDQAKRLAQVISNDTSRKILDFLSKKDHATETEIAKELSLPLSTVHYNLSHLSEAKLVNNDQFTYSEKGKEVIHYQLSNKYVIIAPAGTNEGMLDKLKKMFPTMAVIGVAPAVAHYLKYMPMQVMDAAPDAAQSLRIMSEDAMAKGVGYVEEEAIRQGFNWSEALFWLQDSPATWIVAGALIAVIGYSLTTMIMKKR